MLVWLVAAKRCFPGGFRHSVDPLSSNSESDAHYERKSSTRLRLVEQIKKRCFVLNYCWYARARCYWAYADRLDFFNWLKNIFAINPRHLRRVWDLGRRVFDAANPNLPGLFLLRPCFHLFQSLRGQKQILQNIQCRSWFSSPRAFERWYRNCRNPSGSLANWFFVGLYWRSNPALTLLFYCKLILWNNPMYIWLWTPIKPHKRKNCQNSPCYCGAGHCEGSWGTMWFLRREDVTVLSANHHSVLLCQNITNF